MTRIALCLLAGSLLAGPALAEPPRPIESNPIWPGAVDRLSTLDSQGSAQHVVYLNQVGLHKLRLRNEALRLQAADGGTLTPEHRARLQHELDRINGG